jgi:hypothetical protein
MKNLKNRVSSREDYFSKIIFTLSQCKITEDDDFRDMLSQSRMHVDERNEVALSVLQWRR